MINIIRFFFVSMLLSLAMPSMAGTILYGTVRIHPYRVGGYTYLRGDHFPLPSYEFRPDAYDLKYDNVVPLEGRLKNLNEFKLPIRAILTLVSFDRITGVSKFKFKLQTYNTLHYIGKRDRTLMQAGGAFFTNSGTLKLADGSPPEFLIEGKLEEINGKPYWVSFNRNKYFDIEMANAFDYGIRLKLLQDFPVIVAT